jgi:hypothetical protein
MKNLAHASVFLRIPPYLLAGGKLDLTELPATALRHKEKRRPFTRFFPKLPLRLSAFAVLNLTLRASESPR